MRALITGGAGFIGSHLVDRLLARGDEVTVLDNFATGRRVNLPDAAGGMTLIEGDVADAPTVTHIFGAFRPDVVVHAAASYKDPSNWTEDARTNAYGSAIVARAAADHGVRRLIYLQTALCYGLHPIEQPISLAHPLLPGSSSYAISKTAGEYYIALSGLDWISFRLANAYGPRNLSGPLPTFYSRLVDGKRCFVMETRRDFIYVSDLVDVLVKAIDGAGRSGPYHVSSGRDCSIAELFDRTVTAMNIVPPPEVDVRPRGDDDAFTILLDPTETNRDFDWRAATALKDGIRATIDDYRRLGVTNTYTHLRLQEVQAGR